VRQRRGCSGNVYFAEFSYEVERKDAGDSTHYPNVLNVILSEDEGLLNLPTRLNAKTPVIPHIIQMY
jgi:hypothetical protein